MIDPIDWIKHRGFKITIIKTKWDFPLWFYRILNAKQDKSNNMVFKRLKKGYNKTTADSLENRKGDKQNG